MPGELFGMLLKNQIITESCKKRLGISVPSDPGMTLAQAKKQQPLLVDEINRSQDVKDIFDLCHELEGVVRNVGKHAGGIVIVPGNISLIIHLFILIQTQNHL